MVKQLIGDDMKRHLLATALTASTVLATPAFAANISEQGAHDIETSLSRYIGEKAAKAVSVSPDGDRYKMTVDYATLVNTFGKLGLTLTKAPIFTQFITPLEDGLWKLESDQGFEYGTKLTMGGKTFTSDVKFGNAKGSGVFDEALGYLKNYALSGSDLSWHSEDGKQVSDGEVKSIAYNLKGAKSSDSEAGVNISGDMKLEGLSNTTTAKKGFPVDFTVGEVDGSAAMNNFQVKPFMEILKFAVGRSDSGPLNNEDMGKFKALLENAMPFIGNVTEDFKLHNIAVKTPEGAVTLDNLGYHIDFSGVKKDSEAGIAMSAAGITLPEKVMALPGVKELVPDEASLAIGINGLDVKDGIEYMLTDMPTTPGKKMTPEENEALRKTFLPDDVVHFDFRDFSAKGAVYDIQANGQMDVDAKDGKDASGHFLIKARKFDETIKFLQQYAKINPKINQASFVLMLVKGMAKTEADGTLVWDISVSKDKQVTINGNVLPMPH